jgi:hypothetical protein
VIRPWWRKGSRVAVGVIQQLFCRQFPGELSVPHLIHHIGAATEFRDLPATVHNDNALESGVCFRCTDDTGEWGEASARGQQEQVTTRQQIIRQQGAGRLSTDEKRVLDMQVLQTRRERAVRDLDTEKLEMVIKRRTGHAVRAHQWSAVEFEPEHGELSGFEAERWVAGDNEGKQPVRPVPNTHHFFV